MTHLRTVPRQLFGLLALSLLLSLCLGRHASAAPAPGPFAVQVHSALDSAPIAGAIVRVGGRFATTDLTGVATLDGIPAGTYSLLVEKHEFDLVETHVTLAAGTREPHRVDLHPSASAAVSGTTSLADGSPLAGAAIDLRSLTTASGREVRVHCLSDWLGAYRIPDLPVGTYAATVKAAGCETLTQEVRVEADQKPVEFRLQPTLGATSARVQVLDVVSGAAIDSARVTLAEAWPLGVLAQEATDTEGIANLSRIVLGRLNWTGAESRLSAGSGAATIRIEAEGYESRTVPVPFRIAGTIPVSLNPLDETKEREPNNDLSSATEIRFGAPVVFSIPENGDQDFFRFRLDTPARVRLVVGPDNPLWLRTRVLTATGDVLVERASNAGADNVQEVDVAAGDYFLAVQQYYNNQSSLAPMTLLATRTTAPDPLEPNDAPLAARQLQPGSEARGCVFPRGDRDYFAFTLKRPGAVRLTMPPVDLWRRLLLFDESGTEIATTAADRNKPLEFVRELASGRYTICVRQYYDNDVCLDPYTLRLEVQEDDWVDDPAEEPSAPLRAVRPLELGDIAGTTIHPVGDIDRYAVSLPEAGVLHARLRTSVWSRLRLRARDGRLLTETNAEVDRLCELSWHCQEPQGVVLEVRSYYDNRSAPTPYILSTWWEPADEVDVLHRNERTIDAVPWTIGETLRGSTHPVGDADLYQVHVDHPGYLHLDGISPVWCRMRVLSADGNVIAERASDANKPLSLVTPVLTGEHFVSIRQYYDNQSSALPYEFATRLERAETIEREPLAMDPPRLLKLGEAQPLQIDQHGDRDRFVFDIPAETDFHIKLKPTVWTRIEVIDETTGNVVHSTSTDRHVERVCSLHAERSTRYRLELSQYYNNDASLNPGWIVVDTQESPLLGGAIEFDVDRTDPTNVTFTLQAVDGYAAPAQAALDADGNGDTDVQLTPGAPAAFRYAAPGHYPASARLTGADGAVSLARVWVDAVGVLPREGVQVVLLQPAAGARIEVAEPCRAHAVSYTGASIRRVDFAVNGTVVATTYAKPYEANLPWAELAAGEHTLTVTAYDASGAAGSSERTIQRSEYYGLTPTDGAIITGDDVAVRWSGTRAGRAEVRYREVGSDAWQVQSGERARDRRIVLRDLEPDRQYEIQPLGDGEPGPIRTIKRVRGLAFGRDRYAASIERDYDQRLGVSVRNNGDEPLRVKLECGEPAAASELLVGFVGEGSEGAPIDLEPGEERDFMLGISAQDAMQPRVSFPIRITSDTGYADEAEVVLDVNLPEVKLRWEEVTFEAADLSRELLLHNEGDGLTDLALFTDSEDFYLSPQIEHGVLPAGEAVRVQVKPRLYEGFSEAAGRITASAVATTCAHDVELRLSDGMQVHGVQLIAGAGALDENAAFEENLMAARAMAGAYLNPDAVDWSQWSDPVDTDDDGKLDRWSIDDRHEGILWVGDDTDDDGEIDFVHADIGSDGQYDYSAFRVEDGWEETNLVEAFLEIGFSLPWRRDAYEKHDVDIVMNGVVVASMRDQVPEGNYTFRLPPTAIRFNDAGAPAGNQIEIESKHLRGGHYVVSSDFRIKTRLTGTRVWVVADSSEAARQAVTADEDLILEGPDYSVSSAELQLRGERRKSATLELLAPVRNVGASRTNAVAVALVKELGGGRTLELDRLYLEDVPLIGASIARLTWAASPGNHALRLIVDPDGETGDSNLENNWAAIACEIAGDDAEPQVRIISPAADATCTDSVVAVEVEALDDSDVALVQITVDGGMAETLSPLPEANRFAGQVLLQPGWHKLTASVTDGSGNTTSASAGVTVEATGPGIAITSPDEGAEIDARAVTVAVTTEGQPSLIAGRVNGGPWVTARPDNETGEIELELEFGAANIEVMAVNERGVRATASRRIDCIAQPEDEDEEQEEEDEEQEEQPEADGDAEAQADEAPDGTIDVDGVGPVNVLGPPSAPIPPAPATRHQPKAPAGDTGADTDSGSAPPAEDSSDAALVGSAPATEAQPPTLPPALDRPPLPEDEADEEAAPDDDASDEGDEAPPAVGKQRPTEAATPGGAPRVTSPQPRPAPRRPLGGFIGAQARKSDWYCTNRPKVKLKFRLPDELMRKKLPKPGTPEFDAMMVRLLTDMRMRGYKMDKLEQFHRGLLKRIRMMDQPGDLPGFLESFNIVGPKPDDPAALKAWRENMENTANAWFLRLLSSGDPALVAEGLKARAEAIGQFDLAMQDSAEAAITEIEANQKLVENIAEALPVVGEMSDIYAFVTGESALSGERLSALERFIRIAGVVGPFGLEQLVKRSPNAQMILQAFGEMGEGMGRSGKEMLAAAMGKSYKEIDDAFGAVGKFLTKERRLVGETMEDKMAREARLFAKSPEGIADATRSLKDHAEARDLINRLKNSAPDSDDYAKAVRELQSNKTAQGLINRGDVPDALRKDVNKHIKDWYDNADKGVATGFESLYRNGTPDAADVRRVADELGITPAQAEEFQKQVADFCKRNNVDPKDVVVDKLTITNRRPPKPGEVPKTSVGRDRDVTFQIQTPMRDPNTGEILLDPVTKKPRMIGEDLNHTLTKKPYEREFYKASGEGDLPRTKGGEIDDAAVTKYSEKRMDQTVTSAGHKEAYNTGEVQLDDFLDKGVTPTITRIDDVCDTVEYKSKHWFEMADDAADSGDLVMASRNAAEGMRQATKQYDDLVLARVRQYGLDPNLHVPPRLKASMDVFRQVKDGAISPAKAEAMLKAIGSSKEQAVREMAGFLNGLEKTTGVGWRRIKSAELVNNLASIQKKGGSGWQDNALGAINDALKNGHISGTQFTKLRADVASNTLNAVKVQYPSQWKSHLRDWAAQAYERRLISVTEKAYFEQQAQE